MKKDEFYEALSDSDKTLVHFTAEWCQPCKRMQPSIDMVLNDYPNIKYIKVDIDEEAELASHMNIMSVPTLRVYNGADLVIEKVGAMPYPKLKRLLDV
jgi:thioredoxin 1